MVSDSKKTHRGFHGTCKCFCIPARAEFHRKNLQEITVTNYTGESREYLKKLIMAMGATFTPSMSGKNTVLIAA